MQSRSGKKGGTKQTEKKREAMESKLSEEFLKARKTGMVWPHKNGARCIIESNDKLLPQDLALRLEKVFPFPEGINRRDLAGSLVKVIKQQRNTNYGWSVTINQ